jgi:hypothetical protein
MRRKRYDHRSPDEFLKRMQNTDGLPLSRRSIASEIGARSCTVATAETQPNIIIRTYLQLFT